MYTVSATKARPARFKVPASLLLDQDLARQSVRDRLVAI